MELRELVLKLEIESSPGRRHGCCGGKSAEVICSGWAVESGMGCGGSGLAEG